MDFFERQTIARRNTGRLVIYFGLAVAAIILSVYLVVAVGISGAALQSDRRPQQQQQAISLWHPKVFLWVALGTLGVITIGCAAKISELSQGGSAVAEMLGGNPVNINTSDPDERKLLNVVEEMAIASGTPVPPVYLLPEESINAFAAGYSTSDAVIGVTRGCVRLLTRDELQGVIAHEFSHILNGDMRLNIRLIGFIFGIMGLAIVGRILLYVRGGGRDRNPLPLLGLVLILLGWVGVFFGRLIQSAVSRQREFLADASAVQFTRNPDGLAGALKKIAVLSSGSKLSSAHAAEASHLFFANGVASSFFDLLATHPPLEQRIRAIDPHWDGSYPKEVRPRIETPAQPKKAPTKTPQPPIFFPGFPPGQPGVGGMAPPLITAAALLPALGQPASVHLQYAASFRASLPASLDAAAHEPLGASAAMYALLLSDDRATRDTQLAQLGRFTSPAVAEETLRLLPDVSLVASEHRLALADYLLPGLRALSPTQFQQFTQSMHALIEADRQVDLFEFVLEKMVLRHLQPHFAPVKNLPVQYYSLKPLLPDCAVLLSALAYAGHTSAGAADAAFRLGWQQLRAANVPATLLSLNDCDLGKVDAALNRLAQAVPQIKKLVLHACASAVASDERITGAEAELLRAIADALDCPVPPFVEGVQPTG